MAARSSQPALLIVFVVADSAECCGLSGNAPSRRTEQTEPEQRWITCDLIRCHAGEWGYKDMSEACGPFYFSCPLKYLDLVPIESYGGNAEWRQQVQEHHARQREKRRRKRSQLAS